MDNILLYNNNLEIIKFLEKITTNGILIKDNFWGNLIIQGAGAFFGALFAFLFGLLAFWLQKKRERFIMHKNAVVELESLLWDHYDTNLRNEDRVKSSINTLKKPGHLTYNRFFILRESDQ